MSSGYFEGTLEEVIDSLQKEKAKILKALKRIKAMPKSSPVRGEGIRRANKALEDIEAALEQARTIGNQ